MIIEVYRTLGSSDQDHPAAGMFDTKELVDAACSAHGGLLESHQELTWINIADSEGEVAGVSLRQWTGRTSALVHASGPFPWLDATIQALLPLVVERNLVLYNPQAQSVYNNQRQYPVRP